MDQDLARDDMLILVDGLDRVVGEASKEQAHRKGLLHRAFSVVLVDRFEGTLKILLARRAEGKYHSAGLWANSCCSHPRVGEQTMSAACRRVEEELGLRDVSLVEISAFCYRAPLSDGIVEFEYDHVYLGGAKGTLWPDPTEVSETRWESVDAVARELSEHPERFCAWAPMVLSQAMAVLKHQNVVI